MGLSMLMCETERVSHRELKGDVCSVWHCGRLVTTLELFHNYMEK